MDQVGPLKSITPLQFAVLQNYFVRNHDKFHNRGLCTSWGVDDEQEEIGDELVELVIELYLESILDGDVDCVHKQFTSTFDHNRGTRVFPPVGTIFHFIKPLLIKEMMRDGIVFGGQSLYRR